MHRYRPPGSPRSMLGGLTHELRTPLNSLLMMSELLEEDPDGRLGEREGRYARNIHQAAEDLLELVDQAGEIGRIESGRLAVEARPLAVADLARRIAEERREEAAAAEARLAVEVAPGTPETVVTDPAKLLRAVGLVLTGALQASRGGEVAVRIGPAVATPGGGGIAVAVTDSGPPLGEAERDALFVPFAGAGPRTARRFGGTGLGLTVAWALAKLLGGQLAAEPAGGTGCRFLLTLPAAENPATGRGLPPEEV